MMGMDLLELFDINEKKLYKKVVRGFEPRKGEYIMIAYIFIHDQDGNILLKKNVSTDNWGIPCIYIRHSRPVDTIKEELKCELGLNILNDDLIPMRTLPYNKFLYKMFYLNKNVNIKDINMSKGDTRIIKYFSMTEIERLIRNSFFKENHIMFIECLKKYLQ